MDIGSLSSGIWWNTSAQACTRLDGLSFPTHTDTSVHTSFLECPKCGGLSWIFIYFFVCHRPCHREHPGEPGGRRSTLNMNHCPFRQRCWRRLTHFWGTLVVSLPHAPLLPPVLPWTFSGGCRGVWMLGPIFVSNSQPRTPCPKFLFTTVHKHIQWAPDPHPLLLLTLSQIQCSRRHTGEICLWGHIIPS